ncbi:hypothetical protein EBU58_15625 [bacterium]|nr:hypothetical protein [bacterium]
MPAREAPLAIDAVHVAVRRGVVRRHRWKHLVVGVVKPTSLILTNVVVGRHGPAGVARLLREQRAHFTICLQVVLATRAAGADRGCEQCQNEKSVGAWHE